MLKITDLIASKELKSSEMSSVRGGFDAFAFLASTSISNKVADVDQAYGLVLGQANLGYVTNNQGIVGGNGVIDAPVDQKQDQRSDMFVFDIGNTYVG